MKTVSFKFILSILLINICAVMVYADEVDIPTEEPKSLIGIIIAVLLVVSSTILQLRKRNK